MDVSSARPENLNDFTRSVASLDEELADHQRRLFTAQQGLLSGIEWGTFDASAAINALGQFVAANQRQAVQVATVAFLFQEAGGRGAIKRVPDSVIETYLSTAELGGSRQHLTFDDPRAYGFPPTSGYTNDPINAASGNFVHDETDLEAGDLVLRRVYNSRSEEVGGHGPGWSSWATTRLRARDDGAHYAGPDGQRVVFPRQGPGYGRVAGVSALAAPAGDGIELRWFDGRTWTFDAAGRPVIAGAGPGTRVDLIYDGDGRLVRLVHQRGRAITLSWTGPRIVAAELSTGRRVVYRYDEAGALVEAGDRRYELDEHRRIRSVIDADGVAEVINTYDPDGRVLGQATPFGRQVDIAYLPGGVTVVTDGSDGPVNTFVHDPAGRLLSLVDGHGARLSRTYDQWGNPVSVTDRNGAPTTMEWDDQARLTALVRPTGETVRYRYDDAGRLVETRAEPDEVTVYQYDRDERIPARVIDPEGGVTELTVRAGLLHRLTDPDGVTVVFAFNEYGDVVSATDGTGAATVFERDSGGRVVATVTPAGRRTEYHHDERGQLLGLRTAADALWRFEHTPAGRVGALTDPLGARREFAYGPHGHLVTSTDPLGRSTVRQYDVLGNVVRRIAPDGTKWDFGYDALCRLTGATDPSGATWLREHDAQGTVVTTIDPVGVRRELGVDPAGRVTGSSDGLSATSFGYDAHGRPVEAIRADGTVVRTAYDRCGRRITAVDGTGAATRFEYTPAGRLRRTASPEGRTTTFAYDPCGRLAAEIDGTGGRSLYEYDPDGLLIGVRYPDGGTAAYRYDHGGRLVEARVPGRGTSHYAWDPAGRPVLADGSTFRYDAAGQRVAATDPLGNTTTYAYDDAGRPVSATGPLGAVITQRFDEVGRLVAATDPLGGVRSWAYDPAGRLAQWADASGRTVRLTRDAAGRVIATRAGDGEPITVERDVLGRVVGIQEPGSFRHRLTWDGADRLGTHDWDGSVIARRWTPDGYRQALIHPDGTETTYSYDARGLAVRLSHPALGEITLRRDAVGRVTGAAGPGLRANWSFTDGWLTGYDFAAGDARSTATLVRDDAGRVVEAVVDGVTRRYRYDDAGQLVDDGEVRLAYDALGRLVTEGDRSREYDAAGRLVATGETSFAYDAAGRRIAETGPDGQRRYEWDDYGRLAAVTTDGRRLPVRVDALGNLAVAGDVSLLWDVASVPAAPVAIDGAALIGWGTPWASAGDGAARWLTPDWQGTPGGGRDAWGAPASDPVRIGYRGEVEFAGLTWLRDRVYDPAARGFLSVDPLPAVPGTAWAGNPYHYSGNDPLRRLDPLGQRPVTDAEMQRYRDSASGNPFNRIGGALRDRLDDAVDVVNDVGDWAADHWEYGLAAVVTTAGVVLIATGGGAVAGSGLVAAGMNIAEQEYKKGNVNGWEVAINGGVGAAAGPLTTRALGAGSVALGSGSTRIGQAAVTRVVTNGGVDLTSRVMAGAADASLLAAVRLPGSATAAAITQGFVSRTGEETAKLVTGQDASARNIVDPISVISDTAGPPAGRIGNQFNGFVETVAEKGVPKGLDLWGKSERDG
jgi:RHS repeat-associated protein